MVAEPGLCAFFFVISVVIIGNLKSKTPHINPAGDKALLSMNPMLPSAGIAFFLQQDNDIICWIFVDGNCYASD